LIKYLYFLKKEFDDRINNNTIRKITSNIYMSKMINIRYIVIFDLNQYPLYIYDLYLKKIINIQKCKILYQIKNWKFKFPFTTPALKFYKYCENFLMKINILIMKKKKNVS
jgi:hypothetical protein